MGGAVRSTARLWTKVAEVPLEPGAPMVSMIAHEGRVFRFESWIGRESFVFREVVEKKRRK